ncbi:MAG: glycosyltransferase family 4 protein [Sphingomonas bacterium]|nr:glycosyltransferase family 4 protein [Sphingomonas bacterium]
MTIRQVIERRVLAPLPRRLSRYGYDFFRWLDVRSGGRPPAKHLALLATNDLSRSGAPWVVREIADFLTSDGYDVVVVSMADGPMRDEFERLGARVLIDCYPDPRATYLRRLAAQASVAVANTVVTAALVEAWAPHVLTMWYLHEVSLLERMLADGTAVEALSTAQRVWAGSDMCARVAKARRSDIEVVPYGIEPLEKGATADAGQRFKIGVFGSIEPRKGQDLVIAAVDLLDQASRDQIEVHLYGRVLDADFARSVAAGTKRHPNIFHHGEVDRTGYIAALRTMDAVLVSSRDDTLPLVSIDALSAERVLMLTPDVGTRSWLTDGSDAFIADETSAEGIRHLIDRAIDRRADAASIGAAARAVFDREFSQPAFRAKFREALLSQ